MLICDYSHVFCSHFITLLFKLAFRRAKALIDDIVSRGHESSNGQAGSMQEMIIPAGKAGLIIGKGGETIKQLQVRVPFLYNYDLSRLYYYQNE